MVRIKEKFDYKRDRNNFYGFDIGSFIVGWVVLFLYDSSTALEIGLYSLFTVPMLIGIVILLVCLGIWTMIRDSMILRKMRQKYCSEDIHVMFVYSRSPNWQGYIERNILPRLPAGSTVLDWSDRKQWDKKSLEIRYIRHFIGMSDFNPMAIILRPDHRTEEYRFYDAFREYNHGWAGYLQSLEVRFFADIEKFEAASGHTP